MTATMRYYVVCDDMVQTMPSHAEAERIAAALDHPAAEMRCGGTHIVVDAHTPTEARNGYWRARKRELESAATT